VSNIINILAGTSALPVPGGGDFASTENVRNNNKKLSNRFNLIIAHHPAIILLPLWKTSQIPVDACVIE
jgi:hypothetical protein